MVARRFAGFSLIELLIAMTILSVLVVIAVPSFRDMTVRRQVSSAAQAYAAALRQAQAEAVSRNRNTEVIFTSAEPVPASTAAAAATSASAARRWLARERSAADAAGFITGWALDEHLPDVQVTAVPTSVGFTPLGRAVDFSTGARLPLVGDMVVNFSHVGSSRHYCAFLTTGGAVGVCDPDRATGEPLACQPRLAAGAC